MLGDLGLTYSRYPRPQPGSYFQPMPAQAAGAGGRIEEKAPTNKAPPSWQKQQDLTEQLSDIALRLNSRQLVSDRQVSFRVESTGKLPHLVMVDEDAAMEVSRFDAHEILELEQSMHDMAGFRMSFVT